MPSLVHGPLSQMTDAPPRGHVTALLTPAPCERARWATEREWGRQAEVEKQRESEEKGTEGEETTHEPCSAHCPISTKLYTNKLFFTLHLGDVPLSHFLGTDLNYPMRSLLCFVTRQNKNSPQTTAAKEVTASPSRNVLFTRDDVSRVIA